MADFSSEEQQRRDELLLNLLKRPPQPRPKRDRDKKAIEQDRETPAAEGKLEPSA